VEDVHDDKALMKANSDILNPGPVEIQIVSVRDLPEGVRLYNVMTSEIMYEAHELYDQLGALYYVYKNGSEDLKIAKVATEIASDYFIIVGKSSYVLPKDMPLVESREFTKCMDELCTLRLLYKQA
jgi:hypothetical protein